MLQRLIRSVNPWRVALATSLALTCAFAVSIALALASNLGPDFEPPLHLGLRTGIFLGALAGLAIGGAQALVLDRAHVPPAPWIFVSVIAWAVALPLALTGATLPAVPTVLAWIAFAGVVFELLAGIALALPIGLLAWRCRRNAESWV